MNLLITGNLGYVGPCIVEYLRSTHPDAKIIGADMGFFAHCLTGASFLPEFRLDQQQFVDVRHLPKQLLAGIDAVVHLAAVSNDPIGKAYESATEQINFLATDRLCRLAKEAGVRSFVFASSCSVYGFAEGDARSEIAPLNPLTAYAQSKISAERAIGQAADPSFTVTSLRFPTACGMSPRLRLDLVLNDFVASAFLRGRIDLLSDGTPWRPLIDVRDMARAIEWAINRDPRKGGENLAINVGRTAWNYQIRDLAEAVKSVQPSADICVAPGAKPDERSYRVDFSLYEGLAPDHLPKVPLKESILNLFDGLEKHRSISGELIPENCIRLKGLARLQQCGLINERLEWQLKNTKSQQPEVLSC
jgi:nucleoside-diphosphate-sugar epimerase